jgi:3-hydroxyisobutyrate dehydrogenase
MKVAIAGTGRMGTAMGLRLIEQGHELRVWNRSPDRARELVASGAAQASSAAELAAGADVVITMVTDAAAMRAIYGGAEGLLAGADATLFIEMSTVRPGDHVALEAEVRAAGAALVECPVGGTVAPARQGKLIGFAGGQDADLDRAAPVLDDLCRRMARCGPVGQGAAMKLAANLPLILYWESLGEALVLCSDSPLSPPDLVELLADTSGAAAVLKARSDIVSKALDGEAVPGTFDLRQMRKDLGLMHDEAVGRGRALPMLEAAIASLDSAIAAGLGDQDGAALSAARRRGTLDQG